MHFCSKRETVKTSLFLFFTFCVCTPEERGILCFLIFFFLKHDFSTFSIGSKKILHSIALIVFYHVAYSDNLGYLFCLGFSPLTLTRSLRTSLTFVFTGILFGLCGWCICWGQTLRFSRCLRTLQKTSPRTALWAMRNLSFELWVQLFFILALGTAFTGYVLVAGNMSFLSRNCYSKPCNGYPSDCRRSRSCVAGWRSLIVIWNS